MDELTQRLQEASDKLLEMQMKYYKRGDDRNAMRLKNKREGVTLALSYIREMSS